MKSLEPGVFLECDLCGRRYRSFQNLRAHQNFHTGNTKYRCAVCSRVFMTQGNLNQHIRGVHHPRKFECENCGRRFNSSQNLRGHERTHEDQERKYRCLVCRRSFMQKGYIKKHLKYVHRQLNGGERQVFECENCGRRYDTVESLRRHQRTHEGGTHRCIVCRRAFIIRESVNRHLRHVHHLNGGARQQLECENCGYRTSSRASLSTHCKTHGIRALLHCRMCPKRFFLNGSLRRHVRLAHARQRHTECPLCGRLFAGSLKYHMPTHDGRRRFRCSICAARFTLKSSMLKHKNHVHKRLRPYVCPRCGKGFDSASRLERHRREHEGFAKGSSKAGK